MAKVGVPRRGPVGSKRGRDGAGVGGRKRGKRQAAAPPQDRYQAERSTQAKKGGREGPVWTEKRARQWECLVTSTRVLRPAPDMTPKCRDKEGWVTLPRTTPRPTRDLGPWEVRSALAWTQGL